ncbi:tuftelin-interacting protein 11 [Trichogramma pretiosum]|uniref:tuftelin-interacting protein 11 n=1 Tax=Trichogramma pretiosum TaxID=7493 RepID=UPI0006C93D4C|nr:tuftelin-interacting protein 11 [Trichogramma pretiosum]
MAEDMEKFEISDYDLENEFNINRPRRKYTKAQQMLGVWADSDSDDEPARPSFKRQGKKDYSAPISFITGGVQQAGQSKKQKMDISDDEEDEDAQDNNKIKDSSSESENERPSFSGAKSTSTFNFQPDDIAGLRKKRNPINTDVMRQGLGTWEQHTKGIGAKLLLQMGYQPGKGLGKDLQGIAAPVEAKLRKGRGAIGAYGPEKVAKIADTKASIEESEAKKSKQAKSSQWKKSNKKSNYSVKSVDEIIEDGRKTNRKVPTIDTNIVKCNVIDMTKPEKKTFSGYQHALGKRQEQPDENVVTDDKTKAVFTLTELQHNLDTLVDMCEQNIIQIDRRKTYSSDRIICLNSEKETLIKVRDQHAHLIGTLENVLATVNKLVERNSEMNLKETAEAFKYLQDRHFDEYKAFRLGDLACTFISPKFKEYLSLWSPLLQPNLPLSLFEEWKEILQNGALYDQRRSMAPYDQLVWNSWMPPVRIAIQNWICRQPENLVDLIEMWAPILPYWIMENLLEIILRKLTNEVEEWNPVTDTVPIHTWIHPWLPLMKNKMDTEIYPIIRRKLGNALTAWHPSDHSAKSILQPWVSVFAKGDLDAFLVKHILPKLQQVLQAFVINPHSQMLEQWHWVYDWKDLIPNHIMASMLDKFFFPKWLQVLGIWLNHSPNYEQVTNWYTGWKKMLSDKLLAEPIIKEHFRRALDMMNRSVSTPQGDLLPGSVEQVSYLMNLERTQAQSAKVSQMSQPRIERLAEAVRSASQVPQGFKDLVQKRCEERGILFMPLVNRYRDGKQIYKVGNIQAFIDGDCIFTCHNGSSWLPTNLSTLLDTAEIS